MATEKATIWDMAKHDALSRAQKVKKHTKRAHRQSALSGPIAIMKVIVFLMTLYALAQYVPAFINFKKIITQTSPQSGAQTLLEQRNNWGIAAPLRDYVKMNKAYMRAGQSLQVQYVLPEDAKASLTLKQCRPAPFIEAFRCDVVAETVIDVSNDTVGTRRITLNHSAMYLLQSEVQVGSDDKFDIKWQRN
jgi:hypothetical protein